MDILSDKIPARNGNTFIFDEKEFPFSPHVAVTCPNLRPLKYDAPFNDLHNSILVNKN